MKVLCSFYVSLQFEVAEEEEDSDKKPSRKQKSLGLLCQKFLALYPDYPPPNNPIWISLDEVATSLGKRLTLELFNINSVFIRRVEIRTDIF